MGDNFSYFNFGGDSVFTTPAYTSPSSKIIQHFYSPKNTNQNSEASSLTPQTASSHVQYINHHRQIPDPNKNHQHVAHKHYRPHKETPPVEENRPVKEETESYDSNEDVEDEDTDKKQQQQQQKEEEEEDIRADFPTPPSYFHESVNKYENIENPFADPNFDFDKFLARLRGDTYQPQKPIQTESKVKPVTYHNEKVPYNKFGPENVDLRKPVAFSSPGYKQEKHKIQNPSAAVDDYYYDDDEVTEKPKKYNKYNDHDSQSKYQHNKVAGVIIPEKELKASNVHMNTRPITFAPPYSNFSSNTKPKNTHPSVHDKKKNEEEYEYYDDYDYPNHKTKQSPYYEDQIETVTKKTKVPQITTNRHKETNYYRPKYVVSSSTTSRPIKSHGKVTPVFYESTIYNNTRTESPKLKEIISHATLKPVYTIRPRQKPNHVTDSSRYVTTTKKPRNHLYDKATLRPTTLRPYLDADNSDIRISRLNATDDHKR